MKYFHEILSYYILTPGIQAWKGITILRCHQTIFYTYGLYKTMQRQISEYCIAGKNLDNGQKRTINYKMFEKGIASSGNNIWK